MMDALLHRAQQLTDQPVTPLLSPVKGRVAYMVSHGQSYASNGYAIRTQGIAQAMNKSGFETLCFVRPGRPWELGQSVVNISPETMVENVRYIHSRWLKKPQSEVEHLEASVERFIELFRVYRPETVLAASNYIVGLPAWVAAKRLGLPFYNEVRGFWELSRDAREPGYAQTSAFKAEAERDSFVAKRARKVFTLNDPMKQELAKRGVDEKRIDIVPNGVGELPSPRPISSDLKQRLGIGAEDRVVGYVGSINAYEGLDTLIEACSELVRRGEKLKLLLVGDEQPVTDVVDANKVLADMPWLVQVGRIPHEKVADYYALIDLVAIPRIDHTVCGLVPPLKIIEALAYQKVVLVPPLPAFDEYIEKYEKCLSVGENSVSSWIKGITELLHKDRSGKTGGVGVDASSFIFKRPNLDTERQEGFGRVAIKPSADGKDVASKKKRASDFKAISIMDEISEECWKYEFKSFRIDRKKYKEQVETSTAKFAFLESCWKGNGGTWEYAFTSPGLQHANAQALLDLIPRVKERMPVVFWNKEDPMHYERYLPIAKQANVIFTTDSNKLASYKKDVPDADVYAVPFAAQQKICNPSDRFRAEPETVCFAGSYYGVGHDERKRQMDALLPSIIEFKGAIYDRFSKIDSDRYKFPEKFQPFIRDAVPFHEVVKLYKRFKVFLNVNTIVDSPTMMSRRVYELLACGTPVVSTPSKAIEEQFSGIVHVANDAQEANQIIKKLLTDDNYWNRTSHLGYREVMTKHTYAHRLGDIKKALGEEEEKDESLVSIITCTRRPSMIDRIVENMTRQNYSNCELILMLQDFSAQQKDSLLHQLKTKGSNLKRIEVIVNNSQDMTLGERFNQAAKHARGDFIAKMDDDDFYFEHYLSDMLIPFTFGDYGMVGKKELHMYLSGSNKLIKRFPGMKHREVDFVAGPTFVIKRSVFEAVKFEPRNTGEDSSFISNMRQAGYKIYAADSFNFIQFRADPSKHTWGISDEEILEGKQTKVVADGFDDRYVRV
ncbi:glycosyltransferase [Halomonas elongata]|uniref:glycosyltransferase n=1 Tax=Halomonas elongata TaxID=2746 RepID=UPI004034B780